MADEGAPANVLGTVPDTVCVKGGASGVRSITVIESGKAVPGRLLASPSLALTMRSGADDVRYGGSIGLVLSTFAQLLPTTVMVKISSRVLSSRKTFVSLEITIAFKSFLLHSCLRLVYYAEVIRL